jgi:hypothetical protein
LTAFLAGVDDPIPPSHHAFRLAHTGTGAKAAQELAALTSSAAALAPSGERRGGGAKLKGKEKKLLDEVAKDANVERALKEWERKDLVDGTGTSKVDPAAKACMSFCLFLLPIIRTKRG